MSHTLHSPVYTRPQQLGYKANSPLSTSEQLMMKSQISSDPSEGKSNRRMDQLKTPVSLLNEVCAKAKITPQFETSESGPPHDRVFECLVTFHMHGLALEGSILLLFIHYVQFYYAHLYVQRKGKSTGKKRCPTRSRKITIDVHG